MKYVLSLILTITLFAVTNCTPRVDLRGNLPDSDLIADIEVGHINKQQVKALIGSPSSISPLSADTWYYVSERTETLAFFEPEVKERKILVIRFDQKGVAKGVKIYGLEDAQNINMVERVTPTAGKEFTILKQIFGNIGRFEK